MKLIATTFAAVLSAGAATRAQPPQDPPQDQVKALAREVSGLSSQLVAEREKLLQNVKVNGITLDPRAVMREAVYLTGGKLVEARVADFFILEEMKKQIDGGRPANEFQVTEEDVLTELAPMKSDFETKNPGI